MLKDSEAMSQLVAIVKLQDQWLKHRASALYIDPLLLELKEVPAFGPHPFDKASIVIRCVDAN